jgi:hypothetical protein
MPFRVLRTGRPIRPIAVSVFLAVSFLGTRSASAHAPISLDFGSMSPDTATPLGDPASAGLVYGNMLPYGAQYLSFYATAGQPFHAMVLRSLRGDDADPAIAIVGPGLGDPSAAPFAVPDGDGVQYASPPDQQLPIFIPDLGLRYLAGAAFDGPLQQDGSYYLVIYGADGGSGNYTVGTGYGP